MPTIQTSPPSYKKQEFISAAKDFLQKKPKPNGLPWRASHVAALGDRYFGEYAPTIIKIGDLLGSPNPDSGATPIFTKQQRDQVSDIAIQSKHRKHVCSLVNSIWGIDLGATTGVKVAGREKSQKPASGSDALRDYLNNIGSQSAPPSNIDLSIFAGHLSECIIDAEQKARDHLAIILFIGAALVLFRVQRSLSSDEVIETAEAELYAALNGYLGKKSESALKTALGRISRAYRCSMAAYLNLEEPSVAQYDQLWDFYKKSVKAIPALVDAFFAGKFSRKHLKDITHLPCLEDSPSEQGESSQNSSANVAEKTKAHRIVQKLLKSDNIKDLQKALEKKPPKEQEAVVESTVLAFQKVNRFFESVNKTLLSQHKDAINNEIVRLQAVVQRLEV